MTILKDVIEKRSSYIPCWFMRQAGRYLPEYRNIYFSTGKSFFEICEDYMISSQITLQPIERFGFDAAIVFSDILVIPKSLGCKVTFITGEGPFIKKINSYDELLKEKNKFNNLKPTCEAIKLTRKKLSKEKSMIGFAGAPWTIVCYMIEGGSNNKLSIVKKFINSKKKEFKKIIDLVTDVTINYLQEQINAGANVIQIFDSFAGHLSHDDFEEFVINPTKKIVSSIKGAKVIGFPKGAGTNYVNYVDKTKVDCISIDYSIDPLWIKNNLLDIVSVQGNLDPYLLCYDIDKALEMTYHILDNLSGKSGFIFNLGHGILKETPIENVNAVLDKVRSY